MSATAPDPADDETFLRALVKTSRQRIVHLRWTDRDGSARLTPLASTEAARLNTIARARGLSAEALLRDTAHQAAGKIRSPRSCLQNKAVCRWERSRLRARRGRGCWARLRLGRLGRAPLPHHATPLYFEDSS